MRDIAGFAEETVEVLDETLKDVRIPRATPRALPGLRPRDRREPQGLLVLGARGPRLRLRDLEGKAGKQLPLAVARELIGTGRTERPVTGFRGRSGRSFRARLALRQTDEGKWRVEFDEPWAKRGGQAPRRRGARRRGPRRRRPPSTPAPPSSERAAA